ncbi:MAG: aminodeoxychorismate/anthranilate synthase component II, partial [Erythrobacter sp.]|nr:aminodeoxychorismate/anthranilate synthase component II [Erythrobacter sp.]
AGLPSPFIATRYHSLEVVDVPPALIDNAHAETPGADHPSVMGFRHESLPIHSVQFHPESIATEHGHALLANFARLCGLEPVLPAKQSA